MNGLWAGYTQIWNKYLPDLFKKLLTPLDVKLHALHVGKMWVERVHIVIKSLFQTPIFFKSLIIGIREGLLIKVIYTSSTELLLLSNSNPSLELQNAKIEKASRG